MKVLKEYKENIRKNNRKPNTIKKYGLTRLLGLAVVPVWTWDPREPGWPRKLFSSSSDHP